MPDVPMVNATLLCGAVANNCLFWEEAAEHSRVDRRPLDRRPTIRGGISSEVLANSKKPGKMGHEELFMRPFAWLPDMKKLD